MNQENKFVKRSGTTDKGKDYEHLMIAHVALQLTVNKKIVDFKISSNDKEYGTFDDVVVETESSDGCKETTALQLKHVADKKKTLTKDRLSGTKGDFSLSKYFESFLKIQRKDCKIILFTNLKISLKKEETIAVSVQEASVNLKLSDPHPLLNTSVRDERCLTLQLQQDSPDIQDFSDFLRNFSLYVNQADCDELSANVLRDFQRLFSSNKEVASKYVQFILSWSMREGLKDKLDKATMKQVIALQLLTPRMKSFREDSNAPVSERFEVFKQALVRFDVVITENSAHCMLGCMWENSRGELADIGRINEIRGKYRAVYEKIKNIIQLNREECTELLWLGQQWPLMVTGHESVYKALNLCHAKRVIVLDDEFEEANLQGCTVFQKLSDLKPHQEVYNKVLETCECTFQGKEISLKFLLESAPGIEEDISVNDLLLMVNGSFMLGGEIETLPEPYIPRTLSKLAIDFSYLDDFDEKTLIVISCMNNSKDLPKLRNQLELIYVEEYLKSVQDSDFKRKILIQNDLCSLDDFNKVACINQDLQRCHHFRINSDGLLEWLNSKGNLSDLENYQLTQHKNNKIQETTLYASPSTNNVNILIANPGMGKSVLVKNLKNKLSAKFWVVILYSRDIVTLCQNVGVNCLNSGKILRCILMQKLQTLGPLDEVVSKKMVARKRVVIVWEALDEVPKDFLEAALNVISQLVKATEQQWVTSRPHLKKTLETKFAVMARAIWQFETEEQQFFIRKRLERNYCEEDLKQIVTSITSNLYFARNIDIIGAPLQIYMLTELLQNTGRYSNLLKNVLALSELYALFIEQNLNVHLKEKKNIDANDPFMKDIVNVVRKDLVSKCEKAALLSLMNDQYLQEISINREEILQEFGAAEDCYGIITSIARDGPIVFLHHSYAEYFVARYFARNYKTLPHLKHVLFQEKHENVRLFFDMLLAETSIVHIATIYKNVEILMKNDVDVKDKGGRNPLHLACSWATKYSIMEVKRNVTEQGESYSIKNDEDNSQKETVECKEVLRYLLQRCSYSVTDEIYKMNALEVARISGCIDAICMIVHDLGSNAIVSSGDYIYSCNLAYYSAKFGYEKVLDIFVDNSFIETTKEHFSLLQIAVSCNNVECVKQLLEHKCYAESLNSNYNPLHVASQTGNRLITELLISSGCDLEHENTSRKTPLHVACQNGHLEIVELLTDSGANINTVNKDVCTPLHSACEKGHVQIVELLTKLGANINTVDHYYGWTPLHSACEKGHLAVVELLIELEADIDAVGKDGRKPLHVACAKGHLKVVRFLIGKGASIFDVDNNQRTLLHAACQGGHLETVNLLIGLESNIDGVDEDGWTPLHFACQNGHLEVVKLLMERGANSRTRGKDGWTPVDLGCLWSLSR